MYKEDLALNNLQRLICHKTQPNQLINNVYRGTLSVIVIIERNDIGN